LQGEWHHIAAVFNNGDISQSKLYVDGVLQTLTQHGTPSSVLDVLSDTPRIGGWAVSTQYSLDGDMDEFRLWRGERTADQIAADMNSVIAGPQPNLVAAYSFENVTDGAGGVPDVSGNGKNGTLSALTAASNIVADNSRLVYSVDEEHPLAFSPANGNAITVGDTDDAGLSVTLSAGHGTVTLPSLLGLAVTGGANGGASVTVSGSAAAINAALDGLAYQPNADYNGPDAVVVAAGDGDDTAEKTVHIVVNPVNDVLTIAGMTASGSVPSSSLTATAASYLTANHDLIDGLGGASGFGENNLGRIDDSPSTFINIDPVFDAAGLNFFGQTFHSLYINNNGNITFNGAVSTFTPTAITGNTGNRIIAPFWADVDTRGTVGLEATPGGHSTGSNLAWYDLDPDNHVLTVTWDDVGYYNSHTEHLNAFQLQLIGLGGGDFDIVFRYEAVNWTTGTASGGSNDGLGGTVAHAGYSSGDGVNFFELPQSGNQNSMLALESATGNTNIPGVYVFQVRSGNVTTALANGQIQFADPDSTDTHTATKQNVGNNYLGSFTLDPVNENNDTVAWHFTLNSGEVDTFFDPLANQIRQQLYDVTIGDGHANSSVTQRVGLSVGTAASDTFTFAPGTGQELVFNFDAQSASADTIDLTAFSGIDTFGDIALQAVNNNHDTLINLGEGNSITLIGVNVNDLHSSHFVVA
jgi:hypothetical protein